MAKIATSWPPSSSMRECARLCAFLTEPAIYRPLASIAYLVLFWFASGAAVDHPFFHTAWSAPFANLLLLGLLGSLAHLLPSKPTPLANLGGCSIILYIVCFSYIEPFAWLRLLDRRRLVENTGWCAPISGTLSLAAASQLAGSFSFGLTPPIALPKWTRSLLLSVSTDAYATIRLPMLRFPCGALALAMAWIFLLVVPYLWPIPDNHGSLHQGIH